MTMDARLSPMLCQSLGANVNVDDYNGRFTIEPKLDGWRLVVHRTADGVRVFAGRNGSEYTGKLPYIEQTLMKALAPDTALDGELVGRQGWGDVQGVMTRGSGPHTPNPAIPALSFVAFDMTRYAGHDLRKERLDYRRDLLESFHVEDFEHFEITPTSPATQAAHEAILGLQLEGSVLKAIDSPYVAGRSDWWQKLKVEFTCEAEIIGFETGKPGSALDGVVAAFKVRLETGVETTVKCQDNAMHQSATESPEEWLGIVIEVKHNGQLASGKVRHPRFFRTRADRDAAELAANAPTTFTTTKTFTAPGQQRQRRMRNYGGMGRDKLLASIDSLERGYGDAYERCLSQGSGDPTGDLAHARTIAREKGLVA